MPIIGILKRDLDDSPVRITAYLEDVDALAQAGADIIAIDGTDRVRPVPVETLLARIHHHQRLAMADCSSMADGMACQKLGAEIIQHLPFLIYRLERRRCRIRPSVSL